MRRKSKRKFGKKITTNDWLSLKPYHSFNPAYDSFYLKKAEQIYDLLQRYKSWFSDFDYLKEDYVKLACVLASHFEDFINDIGIWKSFQQTNKKLYGYYLPFYDLSDYDEEYLNPQDFSYLIWHFMSKTLGRIFGPDAPSILDLGDDLYNLLEPQIEDAPVTSFYNQFFHIPADIHFFELKSRLKWFALEAYTLHSEFSKDLQETASQLFEENKELSEHHGGMLYALQDDYLYSRKSSYSALSTLEWFTDIANADADTKQAILKLRKRIMSTFIYEKEDANYWYFQELYTGNIFPVHRESVKLRKASRRKGTAQVMTIVNWKGDWWMTGSMMQYGEMSKYDLERQKKDIGNVPFYAYTEEIQQSLRNNTDVMHECFVEFFGGPVQFFDSQAALEEGMKAFHDFYNKKNVINKEIAEEKQKIYDEKFKKNEEPLKDIFSDSDDKVAFIFVPKIGNLIAPNLAHIISLMQAPSIENKETNDLFNYLFGSGSKYFITQYLLENYPTHNVQFPIFISKMDLLKEGEFLIRFLNPGDFSPPIPSIRHA